MQESNEKTALKQDDHPERTGCPRLPGKAGHTSGKKMIVAALRPIPAVTAMLGKLVSYLMKLTRLGWQHSRATNSRVQPRHVLCGLWLSDIRSEGSVLPLVSRPILFRDDIR